MIIVTKLNDTRFAVNPDLIERISTEPDTTITMVGGVKYVVLEPLGGVIS
jgi:flagellar protein FlbD